MALKINCYVHPNKLYLPGISVSNKKSIGNLKSLVLQKALSLGNVKASGLLLYQARSVINTTQDLDVNVEALFPNGEPVKEKLKPLRAIPSLSSLQLHHLHVIVHVPQMVGPPTTPQATAALHVAPLATSSMALSTMGPPAALQTAQPTAQDVHEFIRSSTLPSYPITIVASTSTAPYTAPGNAPENIEVPGFLTQDPSLLQRMRDDLENYLLRWNTLVDGDTFLESEVSLRALNRHASTRHKLAKEASVWKVTDKCLDIFISLLQSLGRNCESELEVREGIVGVIVDRLVKVDGCGVIAWEDKSPAVFQSHCTEAQIQSNKGELEINKAEEEGFRAIFYKLSVFMLKRKIRWGVLHDGRTMYIFRSERKHLKRGIVISSPLSMHTTTGPTPISLICYMLLSGRDNVHVVDPGIGDIMPASSMGGHSDFFDDNGNNDNNNNEEDGTDDNGGVLPEFGSLLHTTNMVVVDLPAFAKRAKINMSRLPPLFYATSDPVHLLATKFIGEGSFGKVFKAVLCQPDGHGTGLVIKLAHLGHERELMVEAEAYTRLGELAGRVTPAFHGLFAGEFGKSSYSVLVLSYGGKSLQGFDGLSKVARLSIMHKLHQVHQAGIQMNDVKPSNIVQNPTGYYLIDFSVASTNHKCPGIPKCHELMSVMMQLQISADDYGRAGMAW